MVHTGTVILTNDLKTFEHEKGAFGTFFCLNLQANKILNFL